jgi:hypothetical protein
MERCAGRRVQITCVGQCDIPRECIENSIVYAAAMRSARMRRFFSDYPAIRIILTSVLFGATVGAVFSLLP